MKYINTLKIISSFLSITAFLTITRLVNAQIIDPQKTQIQNLTDNMQVTAGYNPMTIGEVVATLISAVLGFLGVIFIILIIVAGFKWMTAGGNDENVKKAQTAIKNALIGLIIVLASYAITYTIFSRLPFSAGGMPNPV